MAPHICAAIKLPFQYFSLKHPSITYSTWHKCVCIPITSNFLSIFPPNRVQHTWLCHFHTLSHCLHLCSLYNSQNPILCCVPYLMFSFNPWLLCSLFLSDFNVHYMRWSYYSLCSVSPMSILLWVDRPNADKSPLINMCRYPCVFRIFFQFISPQKAAKYVPLST